MNTSRLILLIPVLAIGPSIAYWVGLQNARLRYELRRLPALRQDVDRLRLENDRTKEIVDAGESSQKREEAINAELRQARAELANLEGAARIRHEKSAATATALVTNRDPRQGFVRMENFTPHGRASPSDAFQTIVWAAMSGDNTLLKSAVDWDGADRAKAEAFLTGKPSGAESLSTPEDLAALAFANFVTGHSSAQIVGEASSDAAHGTISILVGGAPAPVNFPAVFEDGGWKIEPPPGAIDELPNFLARSAAK
jgi:hypothetical protein